MVKSQCVQQHITQQIMKKELKPIYSDDFYSYQFDLTFLNKYNNSDDGIFVLFTAIHINSRYEFVYYEKNKETTTILNFLTEFKRDAVEINIITADSCHEFTNKKLIKWFDDMR